MERDKKTLLPFVWKIDGFSKPTEDPNGKLYFRYYNTKFPKPRKYADFEYTQPRYFLKFTTPDIPVCNQIEDTVASSECVVSTRSVESGSESNTQIRLRSPRLRTVPTRVAYIQYRKTLHLLHKDSPYRITRRRKYGEIVLAFKAKLIEKLANDIEPMSSPQVIDLQRAKRAISYLAGTTEYCLVFNANNAEEIIGWADSSFSSGEVDRRNRCGYCFQLGRSSGTFVAVCKRSTLAAQSSTEAEFYCLAEATREMLWIRSFL